MRIYEAEIELLLARLGCPTREGGLPQFGSFERGFIGQMKDVRRRSPHTRSEASRR